MNPRMEGMARPVGWRGGPNCGVTAVAIAAGVPFDDAWNAVRDALIASDYKVAGTSRWRGLSSIFSRKEALRTLGVPFTQLWPRRMRLHTFVKRHAKPGRRYQVSVTGHVVTVKDGRVTDQDYEATPIEQHPSERQIVRSALELTE